MNLGEAVEIVLSAAKANANGHERCAEILEACALIQREFVQGTPPISEWERKGVTLL